MHSPTLPLPRRRFFQLLATTPALSLLTEARTPTATSSTVIPAHLPLLPAPDDPSEWPSFRNSLHQWRSQARDTVHYDDRLYQQPEFAWTQRCFCCGFLFAYDQTFYDPAAKQYCVASLLSEARDQFGGYDAVVLWHAYPRLGIDQRNQFDFYRDLPGGILGLRNMVRDFHDHDVRVFLNYLPWDRGTRREPKSDLEVLTILVQALEADGLFLDTLHEGDQNFRTSLDAARPGVALESELALPLDRIQDHHLSWAQWFHDSPAPGVLRNKWLERRHMQHQIRRWDSDHSGEIHTAWMNGSGILVWRNVFGSYNPWNPRDRSLLRTILPIQRRYADLFTSEDWTPLVPTLQPGTYASLWKSDTLRLWTVVNRTERRLTGPLLTIHPRPQTDLWDLVAGRSARIASPSPSRPVTWETELPARGIACLLEAPPPALRPGFNAFLSQQAILNRRSEVETVAHHPKTVQKPAVARPTPRADKAPLGMLAIPPRHLILHTCLRPRECGFYSSTPDPGRPLTAEKAEQVEWFEHPVDLPAFAIDATPVTNTQFTQFLQESGYRPETGANFLKHWGHGHAPYGQEEHPVVWVSLDDARAYANWAGKRLPTQAEWQVAAQGPENLAYPWGPTFEPNRCNDGSTNGSTTPVRSFPQGRSPYNVWDLCGNVWEWTESEHTDGYTRFSLLKGGSYYQARGSNWYADGGPQRNQFASKFLLLWPGLDRSPTIGFRCAS